MTPERLAQIRDDIRQSNEETWGQTLPPATYRVLMEGVHESLAEIDVQYRAANHAEYAADRLWDAFDALQRTKLPSSEWRTRDQIVGLVPSHERRLNAEAVTEDDE